MPVNLDIIQPIVPAYRVPLFERLARFQDLRVTVQCSPQWPGGGRSVAMDVPEYHPDRPASRLPGTPFIRQRGLRLIGAQGPRDVLAVCGDPQHVSSMRLLLKARGQGVGILWWGHHRSAFARSWRIALRMRMVRRLADCVLSYTVSGMEAFVRAGIPRERVFAAGNTIDLSPVTAAIDHWTPDRLKAFRQQQGLEGRRNLLFCSVLNPKTELHIAIRAMALPPLNTGEWMLTVIGDGPLREEYETEARRCGVSDRVLWLGKILEQDQLAPWFLTAEAFVYPGAIGLSLIHAFAYGLPVVTHESVEAQMPEFEAFRDGINGVAFKRGSEADLSAKLNRLLGNPNWRSRLAAEAKQTVFQRYTMDHMTERFTAAVFACSSFSLARRALR